MSGNYLLDTNALIRLLMGTSSSETFSSTNPVVCISVITEIELLSFSKLTHSEEIKIRSLLSKLNVVMLDRSIIDKTIHIRRQYSLKTPDAIIAATAICHNAIIVTDDKVFSRIKNLKIVDLKQFLNS
jgi:predicted nucleic acid-binding protein